MCALIILKSVSILLIRETIPLMETYRFLFDRESSDYKYYDYCVTIEERALDTEVNGSGNIKSLYPCG